jgi:hypothetical protein
VTVPLPKPHEPFILTAFSSCFYTFFCPFLFNTVSHVIRRAAHVAKIGEKKESAEKHSVEA